jgi:hypothetical protein
MKPTTSTTARPWFVCPNWQTVVPLLCDSLTRTGDYLDGADAARNELQRLARTVDGWNARADDLMASIRGALDLMEAGDHIAAHQRMANALRLMRWGDE